MSQRVRTKSVMLRIAFATPALLLCLHVAPCAALTNAERAQAASTTATTNAACTALPKFYWEIGDGSAKLASGTWGSTPPGATTQMNVYSASKWVYGAYVFQRRNGALSAQDLRALRMRDGYTETSACLLMSTVGSCHNAMNVRSMAAIDKFYYASGHF